jgi:hypothetical protein
MAPASDYRERPIAPRIEALAGWFGDYNGTGRHLVILVTVMRVPATGVDDPNLTAGVVWSKIVPGAPSPTRIRWAPGRPVRVAPHISDRPALATGNLR